MTDIQRAMLGDHDAAVRLTEQGVLIFCQKCGARGETIAYALVGTVYIPAAFRCPKCHYEATAPLLTPEQIDMLERMESE